MIKMIIADLDGTLIENSQISAETLKTIERLRNDGYIFTVATGRHVTAASPIIKDLGVMGPVICSNGAYIGIPEQNLMIKEIILDDEIVTDVLKTMNEYRADFLLYTSKRIVATAEAKAKLEKKIGFVPAYVVDLEEMPKYAEEGILKILIIENDEAIFNQMYQHFSTFTEISIVSSNAGFLDIGSKHSSKGLALQEICKYHNVELNEVFAVGDQENDKSMLQESKIGVAMGNASKALKDSADFITKSIEEEGFSYAVKKFIYNE